MTILGDLVKKTREERGMTIRAVAKLTGVKASGLSQLEKGITQAPNLYTAIRLAAALDIEPAWFMAACLQDWLPETPDALPSRVRARLDAIRNAGA